MSRQLIRTQISNYGNVQYYGSLLLGSSKVSLTFIYDTGSNWLWIPTKNCSNCVNTLYNTNSSTAFKQISNSSLQIKYGSGSVFGYRSEDQVWVSNTQSIDKMPLLSVYSEQGMDGSVADGIFGLCPLVNDTTSPPFILDILKSNGLINNRILSFALHQPNSQSVLLFGSPDFSLGLSNPQFDFIVPLTDPGNYYSIELSHSAYGYEKLSSISKNAILDTGTSLLGLDPQSYLILLNFITSTYESEIDSDNNVLTICEQLDIMDLYLYFGEVQVKIKFDEIWSADSDGICTLLLIQAPFWILGDIFLRHFYVVIDYDNTSVQFISSIDQTTSNDYAEGLSLGWIIFIVIVCILIAVGVGTGLGICCKRRQRDQRNVGNPDPIFTEQDEAYVAAPVQHQHRSPWASIEIER